MKRSLTLIIGTAVVALALGVGGTYYFMSGNGHMYRMMSGMHHNGANHADHDEVNMPGLRGENASPEESAEIATLFRGFETIMREVENLPNGIKTITKSSDEKVMQALISHTSVMINRVEQLDDPKIFIQSPTLDIFFLRGKNIDSKVDVTDAGLVVVQTSDDTELVAALQKHAAEVTAMADRGMAAVHEMMMKRGSPNH